MFRGGEYCDLQLGGPDYSPQRLTDRDIVIDDRNQKCHIEPFLPLITCGRRKPTTPEWRILPQTDCRFDRGRSPGWLGTCS
jgi:hypothetical protein